MRIWFEGEAHPLTGNRRFLLMEREAPGSVIFVQPTGLRFSMASPPGVALDIPAECYWVMPEDALRPLMAALSDVLGEQYAGDVAVLRKDYEHERARVDKFIDTLNAAALQALQPVILPTQTMETRRD